MKPIIGYYGGKQRIASRIVDVIRTIPHIVYAEPFAGGSAVLFAKPRSVREAINDLDERIVTLYRVCQTQEAELLHLLKYTPYSQAEYRKSRAILRGKVDSDDLWRAWAVVVNLRQGFANQMLSGWNAGAHNAAAWANYLDALPSILARVRGVYLSCEDATRFIERWDNPDTLFYCDPPYPGTHCGHYQGYSLGDYQRLCDALDACEGSYILSNYPQEIEPRSTQQRIELNTVMRAAMGRYGRRQEKRTEVLWVCRRSGARAEQGELW